MLPVALLVDQPWLDSLPSLKAIGAILALAVVCSAFAYILYFRLIDRAGATNALLVTLLVPPVAIVLGALVLNVLAQRGPSSVVGGRAAPQPAQTAPTAPPAPVTPQQAPIGAAPAAPAAPAPQQPAK